MKTFGTCHWGQVGIRETLSYFDRISSFDCDDTAIAIISSVPNSSGISQHFPVCDWHQNCWLEMKAEGIVS